MGEEAALFNQYENEYCSKATNVTGKIQAVTALSGGIICNPRCRGLLASSSNPDLRPPSEVHKQFAPNRLLNCSAACILPVQLDVVPGLCVKAVTALLELVLAVMRRDAQAQSEGGGG